MKRWEAIAEKAVSEQLLNSYARHDKTVKGSSQGKHRFGQLSAQGFR